MDYNDHPMAHGQALNPHEVLVMRAEQAIQAVFSDADVDKKQTAKDLQALSELIEVMQDSLFP